MADFANIKRSAFCPIAYKSKKKKATKVQAKRNGCEEGDPQNERPSEFDIEVRFLGGLTAAQEAAFQTAAERWSEIIVGDLQRVRLPSGEIVDDVLIDASGVPIDGQSGILGQAAPTSFRQNGIPASGFMEFDTADLARMELDGSLVDVIIHEMGHVLGIGTIWGRGGLITPNCRTTANPVYFGENAMREFATILGVANPLPVPVANTGAEGTRCGHWREGVFGHELMTGFVNSGPNPISRLTIGALEDLGYEVNYDAADDYTLPSQLELMLMGVGDDRGNQRCSGCSGGTRKVEPVVLPPEMHLD